MPAFLHLGTGVFAVRCHEHKKGKKKSFLSFPCSFGGRQDEVSPERSKGRENREEKGKEKKKNRRNIPFLDGSSPFESSLLHTYLHLLMLLID